MKKAIVLAAICGVLGLSSCCRIVDCCFEDPCSAMSNACGEKKEHHKPCEGYVPSCSKPCGSQCGDQNYGPQAKGHTSNHGSCSGGCH